MKIQTVTALSALTLTLLMAGCASTPHSTADSLGAAVPASAPAQTPAQPATAASSPAESAPGKQPTDTPVDPSQLATLMQTIRDIVTTAPPTTAGTSKVPEAGSSLPAPTGGPKLKAAPVDAPVIQLIYPAQAQAQAHQTDGQAMAQLIGDSALPPAQPPVLKMGDRLKVKFNGLPGATFNFQSLKFSVAGVDRTGYIRFAGQLVDGTFTWVRLESDYGFKPGVNDLVVSVADTAGKRHEARAKLNIKR